MKFYHLNMTLLLTSLVFGCSPTREPDGKESGISPAEPQDRNMFDVGIPRGLITNTDQAVPGYVLFAVNNSPFFYLVNREGQIVHQWKSNYGVMGAYLQDDGSLIQNVADPDFPVFAGGGETGRIQKITWDSKILWDFEYATEDYHAHHDFAVMPNGNILAIAWEAKTYDEAIAAGRKPEMIPKDGVWPDKIVEIEPQGKRHGKVVWEWHIWDHLIQDFDSSKQNFGDPADHPELLDINKGHELPDPISEDSMAVLHAQHRAKRNQTVDNRGSDIYHVNAINYHAELDQIAISSPNLSEIFIIDHSTTTEEAAGHSGGRWGKGGDFLYRWGNPQNYHRGDSTDQKLWFQHDVRWIEKGKPGAGNLTLFNNDIPGRPDSMNYSAVYQLVLPVDQRGNYILEEGKSFGPEEPVWTYIAPDTVSFWSPFISGAQRMENGNTLITEGAKGRFFEVTSDGEIVWEYLTQYRGDIRFPNGDPIPAMPYPYIQFRSTFIPADHPALVGKELKPLDPQPEIFKIPPPPENKKGS
jgi:hypothetical protein